MTYKLKNARKIYFLHTLLSGKLYFIKLKTVTLHTINTIMKYAWILFFYKCDDTGVYIILSKQKFISISMTVLF